jgi:signal peptidase
MSRLAGGARLASTVLVYAVLGLGGGLALAIAGPYVVGGRSFTVMSGSMEPAVHTGDVVVEQSIAPVRARVGDVVTFPEPGGGDRLITHRVRSVHVEGRVARISTKGDANNTVERWTAPVDGHIGRVLYRVPRVGYAFASVRTPLGRIVLLVVPVLGLGLMALRWIWRSEPREAPGDEALA